MASISKIEWTEASWNPTTGCTKISPGCKNCYAERLAIRLKAMGQKNYQNGFELTQHENILNLPLTWKKPKIIFVDSMSDLFHQTISKDFIYKTFNTMNKAHWHRYQILTKRSKRLISLNKTLKWSNNIWMGISVENQDYVYRIDDLKNCDAKIKFVSFEPLLGPINNLDLKGLDWIIVGGESGIGARPIKQEWIIEIRDKCQQENIPFFFKQWGGINKKKNGRQLEGKIWDEMPISKNQLEINMVNT